MTAPSHKVDVVAIDGPVGVGKSSVGREVARRLGFVHLDTGAMYRTVAWKYLQLPEERRTAESLGAIARELALEVRDGERLWLDGEEITQAIREEHVSRHVHLAADSLDVRRALVAQQRRIGLRQPTVLEGRDITTVVFPDARWKFYLDAPPAVRAQRRIDQLRAAGRSDSQEEVLRNLVDRDRRDRTREWGALALADDATVIDTSELGEEAVVRLICELVKAEG